MYIAVRHSDRTYNCYRRKAQLLHLSKDINGESKRYVLRFSPSSYMQEIVKLVGRFSREVPYNHIAGVIHGLRVYQVWRKRISSLNDSLLLILEKAHSLLLREWISTFYTLTKLVLVAKALVYDNERLEAYVECEQPTIHIPEVGDIDYPFPRTDIIVYDTQRKVGEVYEVTIVNPTPHPDESLEKNVREQVFEKLNIIIGVLEEALKLYSNDTKGLGLDIYRTLEKLLNDAVPIRFIIGVITSAEKPIADYSMERIRVSVSTEYKNFLIEISTEIKPIVLDKGYLTTEMIKKSAAKLVFRLSNK